MADGVTYKREIMKKKEKRKKELYRTMRKGLSRETNGKGK